jgi:hypothetical protein
MSQPINDGGPAFPAQPIYRYPDGTTISQNQGGMTLRQYAAIKLCVPDSGLPWLDEMIVQSNRERLAAAALKVILEDPRTRIPQDYVALNAYYIADAMLKAREVK